MENNSSTGSLAASDVRVFVPARDFSLSKQFYTALGWQLIYEGDGLAVLELAGVRFYLQDYYVKRWAENFMLHISVEDARAWYEHVRGILESGRFPLARVQPPKEEPYGALVTYVWDPAGVLLHFAQFQPD